ncbi:MAG: hypothetical protein H6816_03665 [Phycisphaerales bacterium]|nr:hypothetical protein [Phycisphaerales bacterium]
MVVTARRHFVFGVRHHGPGSARSVLGALEAYAPDALLVEGPPDADGLIALAAHEEMQPPVALLVYVPDAPQRAVFYPFATFSPEWVALRYGLARSIPVRFMDLPQAHRLVPAVTVEAPESASPEESGADELPVEGAARALRLDPLARLAEIAGFADSERWWDHLVESRRGGHAQVFDAINDAMAALREGEAELPELESRREAYMRTAVRAALKEGCERLAVVCGAWHAPALVEPERKGAATADRALLKGLPKVKTAAAWTPWSYDRLSFRSGYGAGVDSPAYYDLLWSCAGSPPVHWVTQAARLMREKDLDASSAHIIEAVRLAEALAALRGRPLPGLEELDEAVLTVMCFGNAAPMQLIRRKLVIGDRLGAVPEEAPVVPLQEDLARLQKRLRVPVSADEKDYDLDLRKPIDLERSQLLHRLRLLDIAWGEQREEHGKKGTFHEFWRVQWHPEFVVQLIDASRWGSTVADAAGARTLERVHTTASLRELTGLLDDALLADLPAVVEALMTAIQDTAAQGGDVVELMAALPALARAGRYGNVRQADTEMIAAVSDGLIERICVGLPNACASLNDEAADAMFGHIVAVHDAVNLLQRAAQREAWLGVLGHLAQQGGLHGLVAGRAVRLLHEAGTWERDDVERRLHLALSTANDPGQAAGWIEGFLRGSGLLLVHDEGLWSLLDAWVTGLAGEHFTAVLPLLRRTFATFSAPERRQMGERAKRGAPAGVGAAVATDAFDFERAARVLPMLARILGAAEEPA